jgi:hypothetical protein
MSLINDALRRAKQAQPSRPTARSPQFRTVEPSGPARRGIGAMLPTALVATALLALLLLWQMPKNRVSTPPPQLAESRTQTSPADRAELVPAPPPAPAPLLPPAPAVVPTNPAPAVAVLPPVPPPPATTVQPEIVVTNPPPVAEAAVAKSPPLKLQGIFYDPKRPSALINGQSVIVGEHLGDFEVVAITQRSATLVGGGATNVLALGR